MLIVALGKEFCRAAVNGKAGIRSHRQGLKVQFILLFSSLHQQIKGTLGAKLDPAGG